MANQQWPHVDQPGETGPDYVALVIEWDEIADTLEVEQREEIDRRAVSPSLLKKVAIGAGALGALLLARWGVHRLRA